VHPAEAQAASPRLTIQQHPPSGWVTTYVARPHATDHTRRKKEKPHDTVSLTHGRTAHGWLGFWKSPVQALRVKFETRHARQRARASPTTTAHGRKGRQGEKKLAPCSSPFLL